MTGEQSQKAKGEKLKVVRYRLGPTLHYTLGVYCERESLSRQDAIGSAVETFLEAWDETLRSFNAMSMLFPATSRVGGDYRVRLDESLLERLSRCSDMTGYPINRLIEAAIQMFLAEEVERRHPLLPRLEEKQEIRVSLTRDHVEELNRLSRERNTPRMSLLEELTEEHLVEIEAWYEEHPDALASPFSYTQLFSFNQTFVLLTFQVSAYTHLRMERVAMLDDVELDDAYNSALRASIERSARSSTS